MKAQRTTDAEIAARLRERLREGDPGDPIVGGDRLAPGEVEEMRRRMLAGIPERAERRPRLVLVAASLAAAVLALAVGLSVLRSPRSPATPAGLDADTALPARPTPPATVVLAAQLPAPAAVPSRRRVSRSPRELRPPRVDPAPAAPAPVEIAAAEPVPRQIQFETPGGTRVFWVLSPTQP